MASSIVIPERFRGPPKSGNGGYVCGAFADLLGTDAHCMPNGKAAEVTLRAPIPLDHPMSVVSMDNHSLRIMDGERLIAEVARVEDFAIEPPAPPSFADALAQQSLSPSFDRRLGAFLPGGVGFHPICFCCGAQHDAGLKVFAAPIPNNSTIVAPNGHTTVAAAWPTEAQWGDDSGNLPAAFVWTALDCPGQFAYYANGIRTGMLGRLTARLEKPIRAGEPCVVTGWCMGVEGKKHFAGTAVFNAQGERCALAAAVWIGRREE